MADRPSKIAIYSRLGRIGRYDRNMSILVTGGAGYIGAHVVRLLQEQGQKVIVVDDLSYGTADRIGSAPLIKLDLAETSSLAPLTEAMMDHDVDSVIHFAARKQVGESVERPSWYYQQNVGGMATLLRAMYDAGVDKLVFSSSAAVYGMPDVPEVPEDLQCKPINPYGETKLVCEWMSRDCERAWGLKWTALRYFNVAGAGWDDLMDPARLNLVPMILERLEKGGTPMIFGDDYDTPDGTCVRDYVHVKDLADAHIKALDLIADAQPEVHEFNIGTGHGTSVREIIEGLQEVSGWKFPVEVKTRRAGDPPVLVGSTDRSREVMSWKAEYGVNEILTSAWEAWQASKHRITVPKE